MRDRLLILGTCLLWFGLAAHAQVASGPAAAATQPAVAVAADLCKGAVDPYDAGPERVKFFRAAGKTNEMTEEAFNADAKRGDGFIRPFDVWKIMLQFDKDHDNQIDWFEADAYRQDLRMKMLALFDKGGKGRLEGDERLAANRFLAAGKLAELFDAKGGAVVAAGPAGTTPVAGGTGAAAASPAHPARASFYGPANEMAKAFDFTDEQQAKVAQLTDELRKTIRDFEAANEDKIQDLSTKSTTTRPATEEEKQAALKAGRELGTIMLAKRDIYRKYAADLQALLSEPQKAKWFEHQVILMVGYGLGPVKLTDDQTAQVRGMYAELAKDIKAGNAAERNKVTQALLERVKKEVLTDAQRHLLAPPPPPPAKAP